MMVLAFILAAIVGTNRIFVTEGANASISADGTKVAFQRYRNGSFDIGVLDIASGSVEWIDEGPADAAYPTWSTDGSVAYVRYEATNTAFQAVCNDLCDGFNLFLYKNGRRRRLTRGRWFDSTSAFAPDGKTLYYVSSEGEGGSKCHLWRMDVAHPGDRKRVLNVDGRDAGVASPSVSPDGKWIVWSQYDGTLDAWHLCLASEEDILDPYFLTGIDMVAWSPKWHPDCRHVVFSGYREGDVGWSVYMIDVESGETKKILQGRNASVFPDGRLMLYEDGGCVYMTSIDVSACFQGAMPRKKLIKDNAEKIIWRSDFRKPGERMAVSPVFLAQDEMIFVRALVEYDGDDSRYQEIVHGWGGDGNILSPLRLYFARGFPHFSTRDAAQSLFSVKCEERAKKGRVLLTGIRSGDGYIYLFVDDGRRWVRRGTQGLCRFCSFDGATIAPDSNVDTRVLAVEVGTGWPRNVNQSWKVGPVGAERIRQICVKETKQQRSEK